MNRDYSVYVDAVRIALQSVFSHKLRTFLTLIGIIIGVAAVVVVGASISGLNSYVTDELTKVLGANHFMIARMVYNGKQDQDELERQNRRNKRIDWIDYEAIRDNCTSCTEVGAAQATAADLSQEGVEFRGCIVFGVTANMVDIEDKTIAEGRFLAPNEVDHSTMVVVLGGDVKDKFFPNTDAIGKTLKVGGLPFRVIGVEEKRGSFFGSSFDRHIYIPVTTHMKIFGKGPDGLQIHGQGRDREHFQAVLEDARIAMRNQHHLTGSDEDDFGIVNVQDLNQQVDQFTGSIALVVIPITLITLIVGGIVVMNIMLVSVTERTFEVGLRKAVGATRGQIVIQFLIESVFLCALGGFLGLSFAFVFCELITLLTGIVMTITLGYILLSTLVSSFIGIIAGVYPAFKASHLDPIAALCQGA